MAVPPGVFPLSESISATLPGLPLHVQLSIFLDVYT